MTQSIQLWIVWIGWMDGWMDGWRKGMGQPEPPMRVQRVLT